VFIAEIEEIGGDGGFSWELLDEEIIEKMSS